MSAAALELQRLPDKEVDSLVGGIGDRLADILDEAQQASRTPLQVARIAASRRLDEAANKLRGRRIVLLCRTLVHTSVNSKLTSRRKHGHPEPR